VGTFKRINTKKKDEEKRVGEGMRSSYHGHGRQLKKTGKKQGLRECSLKGGHIEGAVEPVETRPCSDAVNKRLKWKDRMSGRGQKTWHVDKKRYDKGQKREEKKN